MDTRIREGIEACRPGSDDLLEQELADVSHAVGNEADARDVSQRVQKWDAAVVAAMDQVEVPVGLAERILARLTAVDATPKDSTAAVLAQVVAAAGTFPSADEAIVNREPSISIWQRRHWAGASLSAIGVAVLVVAAGYWLQLGSDLPLDQLASHWQDQLTGDWQSPAQAPVNFPVPEGIRVPPSRWQWIGRLTPTPVVAYELLQGKAKAMLYAARMTRAGLSNSPPIAPQMDTAGQAVGYWRSGEIVYVLVVPDVRSYRAFVRPSSAPLAVLLPLHRSRGNGPTRANLTLARKIA